MAQKYNCETLKSNEKNAKFYGKSEALIKESKGVQPEPLIELKKQHKPSCVGKSQLELQKTTLKSDLEKEPIS